MYGISTHNFVSIHNYEQAKAYYESTDPIRGQYKSYAGVPLHGQRRSWRTYSLRQRGNSYAARLYSTDVVTWHPDGWVDVDVSYNSTSTNAFARVFTAMGNVGISADRVEVAMPSLDSAMRRQLAPDTLWAWLPHKGVFSYRVNDDRTVSLRGIHYATQERPVDRSLAAQARKQCNEMLSYVEALHTMLTPDDAFGTWRELEPELDKLGVRHLHGASKRLVEMLLDSPDNLTVQTALAALTHLYTNMPTLRKLAYDHAYKDMGILKPVRVPLGVKAHGKWSIDELVM